MICEMRREEDEGLLTAVGDRESWRERGKMSEISQRINVTWRLEV